MKNQMDDLVPQHISGEFLFRIAENKQASLRMDSAGPFLEFAESLKLLPIFGTFKNIYVRFDVGQRLIALQFLCHDAIMKLGFDRDRRRDIAMDEVVNEMLGLAVFPLRRVNAERFFAERIGIALAKLGELNFR